MTDSPAVLSVDLEFFTHLPAYRNARGRTERDDIGLAAVDDLIAVFDDYDVSTTFFVVSDIAERHPDCVERVAAAGHEIASHTHRHRHLTTLDEHERREEIDRSRTLLEDVTGTSVTGFRAPSFDTAGDHFSMLAAAGYEYDSSIVPCRSIPGWYGGEHDIDSPVPATQVQSAAPATITELPVSTFPGIRLPLTGTWLRFFGPRYTTVGMRLLARRGICPVLYVHPWEFADLPDVAGVPNRVYWHTGSWMRRSLLRILDGPFEFITARSAVESATESDGPASSTTSDTAVGGQ